MAIRHIADLITNNSNTYNNTDEFHAEHGLCGKNNVNCTSVAFELLADKTGVRRTVIFEDQAQFDLFFPSLTDKQFTVTKIEKVDI